MKKMLTVIALLYACNISAQQNDTVKVTASLAHATVYYGYGAELQHTVKATLINGLQQVVIDNLALQPDANTIQIACPENVTILSFYHRIYTNPLVAAPTPANSKSNDTIRGLQKLDHVMVNDVLVNEDLLKRITALIENNFVTDNKKQLSSAELIKLTDYYTERVRLIKMKLFELQLKRSEIAEKIDSINTRLKTNPVPETAGREPKRTGQLILQVMAQNAGAAGFDINYFTRNAGWIPAYDIRVKTLDNSLKLVYKASVQQTTGLDWKNLKLSLSTSNPNQGTLVPSLAPVFLQLYVPQLYNTMVDDKRKDNNASELSEVVITGYGKQKPQALNGNGGSISANDISNYMTLKESQLNTNFEIDLPYDIPSDGKSYSIAIKDEMLIAGFKHYAVPKLDNDAFLVAELNRWDSLSLLPGEANIIMDNVYLGKSFIDPNTTTDTLTLSLGRDKRIALKRQLIREFSRTTIKGENKTETFTWEISLRNNKKQSTTITVKDQYPVSRLSGLEIKLMDDSDGDNNTETGILTWNIKLQPGESKKIRFSYSVKYPKVNVLQELH